MAKSSKFAVETTFSIKKLPNNGLIPSMLKLLELEGCNGYYNKDNTFVAFEQEQTFEVHEVRVDNSPGLRRLFYVKMGADLVNLEIQGTHKDRVLMEAPAQPTTSSVVIFRFLRLPLTEGMMKEPVSQHKERAKTGKPSKHLAPQKREWIPQLKQFVKIRGGEDLYIINDYDAYKGVFVLSFADARMAKHMPNQTQFLEIYPTDLEPYVLTY